MAIAQEISEGRRIPFVAGADLTAGTPVVLDDIVVVPHANFTSGDDASGAVEGLFRVAKEATTFTTAFGTKLYYDVADGEVNDDSSGNKLMAIAVETTIATDTTVLCKLQQA